MIKKIIMHFSICSTTLFLCQVKMIGQVIPDQSLDTIVSTDANGLIRVNGGRQSGSNLFHSLSEFSINPNQQIQFENGNTVRNILTRITGSEISNLNGSISTLNPANLYILNKNGIVFGDSIQLNIGGSLFASTASSILFDDGLSFTSALSGDTQLISSGYPNLIRFSGDSGSIRVNGRGNELDRNQVTTVAIGAGQSTSGIRLGPEQQIVLLGDGIEFNGGLLTVSSGDISIGSIRDGDVAFRGFQASENNSGVNFDSVIDFSDVNIRNRSIVDATGFTESSIAIYGQNFNLTGGSYVVIQSEGGGASGEIDISFQDSIFVRGINDNPGLPSSFSPLRNSSGIFGSSVFAQGVDIAIVASTLELRDAGIIGSTVSFGGVGGNVDVDVSDTITIRGDVLPDPLSAFSTIFVTGNGEGVTGSIDVAADNITLLEHGTIQSVSLSAADSQRIRIVAGDSIVLGGLSPVSGVSNFIQTSSFQGGTSADLVVRARRLEIFDGSVLGSVALASGASGNIDVDITDSILVSGFAFDSDGVIIPSAIGSFANQNDSALVAAFGLPPFPSGDVGSTLIKTSSLTLENNGVLSASNEGFGATGDLTVIADTINLNQANIFSFATSDNGGSIDVISSFLRLNDSSSISVNSLGQGDGGNISVDSDLVILDSGSNIVANSADAQGGNISIDTIGLFISPDSQITASSSLGQSFSGTININTPNVDLLRAATSIETPPEIPALAVVCNSTGSESELSVAGSTGVPLASNDYLDSRINFYSQGKIGDKPRLITNPVTGEKEKFERFVGWKVSEDGKKISLVADPNEAIQFQSTRTACLNNSQST